MNFSFLQTFGLTVGLTTFIAGFSTFLTQGGPVDFNAKLDELNDFVSEELQTGTVQIDLLRNLLKEAEQAILDRAGEGLLRAFVHHIQFIDLNNQLMDKMQERIKSLESLLIIVFLF